MFTLTISTPFFNEEDGINHFTETLTKILKIIPNYIKVSLIWINDGSTDNTLDKLLSKKKFFPNNDVKIISHKKIMVMEELCLIVLKNLIQIIL